MHVMIIGAAGMLGRKLALRLLADRAVGARGVSRLTLADVVAPEPHAAAADVQQVCVVADLSCAGEAGRLIAGRPDVVFHLAAIVSGDAEADLEKGYRINLDGTRHLLDAIRHEGAVEPYCPRMVFTSSLAVFGEPLPEVIPDDFVLAPLSSYGTQKAMGELLVTDYTRRGFLDGISLRLPTICVRPGRPNKAASGFYSSIIREPLVGQEAILPVPRDLRHWFASPRSAVAALLHAAAIDLAPLGARRSVDLPGVSASVAEQIEALGRVAGRRATALIREEPDAAVLRLVSSWPKAFSADRAKRLGFRAEGTMDEIIRAHIDDELGGKIT